MSLLLMMPTVLIILHPNTAIISGTGPPASRVTTSDTPLLCKWSFPKHKFHQFIGHNRRQWLPSIFEKVPYHVKQSLSTSDLYYLLGFIKFKESCEVSLVWAIPCLLGLTGTGHLTLLAFMYGTLPTYNNYQNHLHKNNYQNVWILMESWFKWINY